MKAPNRYSVPCFVWVLASAILASAACTQSWAQSDDNSRGVRIIDGPTSPQSDPAGDSSLPQVQPPVAPQVNEDVSRPASAPVSTASPPMAAPPAHTSVPSASAAATTDPGNFSLTSVKAVNPAEVAIEIVPGPVIATGSTVSFRINTKKPGYLILIDVDPTGKLTQIYPSPTVLNASERVPQNANYVRPGRSIQLPSQSDPFAGYEFVAAPPHGTGLVMALLSNVPVQRVDMPDVPNTLVGQESIISYLMKVASELRIPRPADGGSRLLQVSWSVDAKFYTIREP